MPWIISAVGAGVFGFALATMGDVALTYTMDSYKEVRLHSLSDQA